MRALSGHPDIGPVPDVILCVVDAGKLQRSLLPAFQAAPLRRPMVLALNFFDEAKAVGWRFDLAKLEERLGIPVVPTVGHKGEGIAQLKAALLRAHRENKTLRPPVWSGPVASAIDLVAGHLGYLTGPDVRRFRAQRLLFDTSLHGADDLAGSPAEREETIAEARRMLERAGHCPATAEPVLLFPQIGGAMEGCAGKSGAVSARLTDRLDGVLLHRVWGLAIFAIVMFGVFQAVYSWAVPLMSGYACAILAMSVVIWALLYFPRPDAVEDQFRAEFVARLAAETGAGAAVITAGLQDSESGLAAQYEAGLAGAFVEQSFLGRAGKLVQPVFAPSGFDWKITVGILASFPAREVILATLGIIYHLGGDEDETSPGLRDRLARETWSDGPLAGQPVFTVPVAAAIMVFFAICMQCGATIAMMTAETNWRWAWGAFAVMTAMAWIAATATHQILEALL